MILHNYKWAFLKKNKNGLYVLNSWNVWKQKWTAKPGSASFLDEQCAARCAKEESEEIEAMFVAHGMSPVAPKYPE